MHQVTFGGVIEALASKLGLPSAHLSEETALRSSGDVRYEIVKLYILSTPDFAKPWFMTL
jgi:hypothetical protein